MSQTSATRNPAPKAPPLSNAERQRRWRERLKAKASGAAVTEHARDVVARAIMALWDYHERPGPGGIRWADVDGCSCIEDYVCELAAEDRGLAMAARAFLPGFEGLTPEEARALAALIALADVIDMRDTREDIMLGRLRLRGYRACRSRRPRCAPRRRAMRGWPWCPRTLRTINQTRLRIRTVQPTAIAHRPMYR
jgi:hypothetical protein